VRVTAVVLLVAVGILAFTDVPAPYVLGPLAGLAIARVGIATFTSIRAGGDHLPDGDPTPVDLAAERVTYWCEGCGAEVLLLVRGTTTPPRHCGERMNERHEVRHIGPLERH
jgi:hypothetical protein